jgi:hypothetical protein
MPIISPGHALLMGHNLPLHAFPRCAALRCAQLGYFQLCSAGHAGLRSASSLAIAQSVALCWSRRTRSASWSGVVGLAFSWAGGAAVSPHYHAHVISALRSARSHRWTQEQQTCRQAARLRSALLQGCCSIVALGWQSSCSAEGVCSSARCLEAAYLRLGGRALVPEPLLRSAGAAAAVAIASLVEMCSDSAACSPQQDVSERE